MEEQRVFFKFESIINVLVRFHLNTNNFTLTVRESTLVCGCQILTPKVDPRAVRVNVLTYVSMKTTLCDEKYKVSSEPKVAVQTFYQLIRKTNLIKNKGHIFMLITVIAKSLYPL